VVVDQVNGDDLKGSRRGYRIGDAFVEFKLGMGSILVIL